ncbi:MAG: hypothetical protein A2Y34_11510 [Spirochaetes bacterium GWC1_27_15]|nr:MAG: hypothetical protein A2Z98_03935 [Spirochaetes bacterium GWB1_27_13]OHD23292.1 MAG: hypothetical protein A2Y34_11510 [Spirochaetes bacterium GWC1_27_15]
MKINSDFIEKNLIAYIGNKRRLLPLIKKSIEKIEILNSKKENLSFLDLFAGTGVVSRLAKTLGFEVFTNDWEYYSYIMNKAFIEINKDFLEKSFSTFGGVKNVINILNNLNELKEEDKYISLYYCPKSDETPDLDNERMFYTNYNGRKIDAIRAKIEEWKKNSIITEEEETFLLALLLYEASTRSNTSGVFKAFHRGFGGSNGDALTRILKKLELSVPELANGKKCSVFNDDAVSLSERMKNMEFDVVYLDPPYNQHQYGSNYHLLNTIALNDKPEVNKNIYLDGKKINKSAIRKDWIKTKSSFCYKDSAKKDFEKMIKNLNANYFLISYSIDGIIPFEEMLEILSQKGKLDIVLSEYVKFRGGKQALTTEIRNIEFIIIVDTTQKGNELDITHIRNMLSLNRVSLVMKKTINPIIAESIGFQYRNKVSEKDLSIEKVLCKNYETHNIEYSITKNKIKNGLEVFNKLFELPPMILENVLLDLENITNLTKEDEIHLSLKDIAKFYEEARYDEAYELFKNIPYLLSKFNNRKAYITGLKTIIDILKNLCNTQEIWKSFNILDCKYFGKLEKIILFKLNYNYPKEEEVSGYKKEIASLYEHLLDIFENKTKEEKTTKSATKKESKVLSEIFI